HGLAGRELARHPSRVKILGCINDTQEGSFFPNTPCRTVRTRLRRLGEQGGRGGMLVFSDPLLNVRTRLPRTHMERTRSATTRLRTNGLVVLHYRESGRRSVRGFRCRSVLWQRLWNLFVRPVFPRTLIERPPLAPLCGRNPRIECHQTNRNRTLLH